MDKKNRTLAIRPSTHKIFRLLNIDTGKPIIVLLHEAALLLQEHYAAQAADTTAEVPQRRSTDTGKSFQSTEYPTAA